MQPCWRVFFDTHSKAVGNEFRDTVFKASTGDHKDTLRSFGEKFAAATRLISFVVDADGKLAALSKPIGNVA